MSIQWANSLLAVIYAAADWVAGAGCVVRAAGPVSGKITPVMAAAGDSFPRRDSVADGDLLGADGRGWGSYSCSSPFSLHLGANKILLRHKRPAMYFV